MSKRRAAKIDGEMQRALGEIFLSDIKDPRFSKMAGVLRVEVTQDLKYAKVYVSIYDTPAKVESTMQALESGESFIRARLNDKIRLRRIPNLSFIHDTSIAESVRISRLIDEVTAKDREHAADNTDTETVE